MATPTMLTPDGKLQFPEPSATCGAVDMKKASIRVLLKTAASVVDEIANSSTVFDASAEGAFPKFRSKEVVTGNIIGRGGFCVVREVEKIRLGRPNSLRNKNNVEGKEGGFRFLVFRKTSETVESGSLRSEGNNSGFGDTAGANDFRLSRDYVALQARKTRKHGTRYVVKSVSKDLSKINYMKGSVDIAVEAKFLTTLDHPNIIELVALSTSKPCTEDFFLILEKMNETLSKRIKQWMDRDRLNKGVMRCFTGGAKKEQDLYRDRIAASYDIASALHYLHGKNIVFRDLKPDNVGFDMNGFLKLFDFGLAKELAKNDLQNDGTYRNVTGMTGPIRYMAPEVGNGQPYNFSVDVYSWSMIMWFILALEPPFGFYSEDMIRDRVHTRGVRPAVFNKWNGYIGEMLKYSWDSDMNKRPSFLEITLVLKQELIDLDCGSLIGSTTNSNFSLED